MAERRGNSVEWKRRADDMSMQLLLEKLDQAEKDARVRDVEARKFRMETTRDIRCLGDGFKAFQEEWDKVYKPHLDSDIDSEKVRRDFIREKIRVWSSRAFDACVGAVFLIFAYGLLAGDWVKKAYSKIVAML